MRLLPSRLAPGLGAPAFTSCERPSHLVTLSLFACCPISPISLPLHHFALQTVYLHVLLSFRPESPTNLVQSSLAGLLHSQRGQTRHLSHSPLRYCFYSHHECIRQCFPALPHWSARHCPCYPQRMQLCDVITRGPGQQWPLASHRLQHGRPPLFPLLTSNKSTEPSLVGPYGCGIAPPADSAWLSAPRLSACLFFVCAFPWLAEHITTLIAIAGNANSSSISNLPYRG